MITIYEYDHVDPVLEVFRSCIEDLNYRFYASDLLQRLISSPDFDPDLSVKKAVAILKLTGLPVQEHIRCVYRSDPDGIRRDWKLSELACGLLILSYEYPDAEAAELQELLIEYLNRV